MQSIDLYDELEIEAAASLTLDCDRPELAGEENLAYRAAALLQREFKTGRGARLTLSKRIPVAAGLGGGSSDAAAVLIALNGFWQLNLPMDILVELAADLGADVAFFLSQKTQLVKGFGQKLAPLNGAGLSEAVFVLANPGRELSAGDVYREFDSMGGASENRPSAEAFLAVLSSGKLESIAAACHNDLQPAALALCPEVGALLETARNSGAIAAFVSGSGPTVVALTDSDGAPSVAAALAGKAPWTAVCRAEI